MAVTELQLPIDVQELRSIFHKHGAISAKLFGSSARGEARPDSDLDFLVELEPNRSLFDLGGLQYELQEAVGRHLDITTKLHPRFEPYITPDLVEIL